jgi:hypothetical protein
MFMAMPSLKGKLTEEISAAGSSYTEGLVSD